MFDTKGIDIMLVITEARSKGNVEFAELLENQIKNLQICYDVMAQKYTSTGGDMWQIDAEYVKGLLHK
jgi:hypothetical protein